MGVLCFFTAFVLNLNIDIGVFAPLRGDILAIL
jgi:hypothetical protein